MLNRVHHGHDRATGVFAAATGPQTIELWRVCAAGSDEVIHRASDATVATRRSALRGVFFVAPATLVSVHATGTVAAWRLANLDDDEPLEAQLDWEESLDFPVSLVEASTAAEDEGTTIAIGGKEGQLAIARVTEEGLDVETDEEAHDGDVTAIGFCKEGKQLATGARDRLIKIWQVDGKVDTEPLVLDGCEAWPLCVAFSGGGERLVTGAMDNGVYLWDLQASGEDALAAVAFEHHGWVVDIAWAPDDEFVASASWDNTIGIFTGEDLLPSFSYDFHRDYVSSLHFVADSPHLISAGYDHTLCVWNYREARLEKAMRGHHDWVLGLDQIDDQILVSVSSDKTARLWSCDAFECIDILGESTTSGFELGADSGLIDFVDDELDQPALEGRRDDEEPGGVRVERPDEATPAVRKVRSSRAQSETTRKTPMRILDEAVHRTLDEALSDDDSDEEDDDRPIDGLTETSTPDSPTARLDAAELDDLVSLDQGADEASDVADGDAPDSESPSKGATSLEGSALSDAEADFEASDDALDALSAEADWDDEHRGDGAEPRAETDEEGDDHKEELLDLQDDSELLEDFIAHAPEDLGLEAVSSSTSSGELDTTSSSPLDELREEQLGEFSSMGVSSEEAPEPGENPFASSPQTQPLAEERVEQAVSRDREDAALDEADEGEPEVDQADEGEPEVDESDEGEPEVEEADEGEPEDDPDLDAQKERLRAGLRKLRERARSKKDRAAESEARAESTGEEGREVPTSQVDLGIDEDVASAFDDLVPEPEEPSPPSLGQPLDEASQQEEAGPRDDQEPVDPVYGNQTQMGMLSQGEEVGQEATVGRLMPGESEAEGDLDVPEVSDEDDLSAPSDGTEGIVETELSDLWERRSSGSAPGMGIVKRPLAADTLYELHHHFETPHRWTYGVDLHIPSDHLVTCGGDATVAVWNLAGELLHSFEVPEEGMNDVHFHPDGALIFAGGEDHCIHAWLLPSEAIGRPKTVRHAALDDHRSWVTSLAVSDNGKVLISGSFDGTARAWHLKDGALGAVLEGHDGSVTGVGFSGKRLITAGDDGTIRVWNARGLQLDQLDGFGHLTDLACRKNRYAWTSDDGRAFVYRDERGTRELVPHDSQATAVDLRPDGSIVTGGADGRLHLYAPGQDEPFQTLEPGESVWAVRRYEDYLVAGTDEGGVYLYRRRGPAR